MLAAWVDAISQWPADGEWMHHHEATDDGPRLCRTENIVPFHAGIASLLCDGTVVDMASALLGDAALLYKEKINYKLVGGAGYAAHQDAPAYPFVDHHVSAMIAVDDATEANGCLELVSGRHVSLLPADDGGRIRSDVAASLSWEAAPLPAGHILWFGSFTPHRSGPNRSARDRRALYPTFNAAVEGDLRAAYYDEKRATFARTGREDGRAQVSLIDDFMGRAVT